MNPSGHFPSGQPILPVRQADCTPKRIFVLGVYASAVHARWTHPDGRPRITALVVASEPGIFGTVNAVLKGIFFSRIEKDRLPRLLPAKPQISEYRTAEFRRKVSPIRARTSIFVIRDSSHRYIVSPALKGISTPASTQLACAA